MASSYYDSGAGRAAQVQRLFNRIAARYDWINDVQSLGLHRLWKRNVLRLAQPSKALAALDICCGTGDLAFGLASRGAKTTGLDFSDGMLNVARERLTQSPALNVQFVQGDALQLPFADAQFNIVTMGYGLRNLADLSQGLREVARVLKPGGRFVALEFGVPEFAPWRALYFLYLRLAVPIFGALFCGDSQAYAYILDSLKAYPGPQHVARQLTALGFQSSQLIPLAGGVMSIHLAIR